MNSRRHFLTSLATVGAATIAGCGGNNETGTPTDTISESPTPEDVVPTPTPRPGNTTTPIQTTSTPDQTTATPDQTTPTETTPTPTPTETPTPTPTPTPEPDRDLSGEEIYLNWIHGEDGQILEQVQGERGVHNISFQAIDEALEEGFQNGGRNRAVANALKTASQEYVPNNSYEQRHRHILSALHQTLEQKTGEDWDFDIVSNMNYTQTAGETLQFSEVRIENGEETEDGEPLYDIVNAAISPDYRHAPHTPGEKTENGYKRTMQGVRESDNDVDLPPHDTEALQERGENSGYGEKVAHSFLPAMGYQLFAGGHSVDSEVEYNPDQSLVPASKEVHETIDNIGYEQGETPGTSGRIDLQMAINEKYFNEGYDETDNPVAVDVKETSSGWNVELEERPDWTWEDGYPAQAS
jgi:hypothetical protein